MAKVTKFPVKAHQRELNRRGKMALNCILTDRWIKVGSPAWAHPDLGVPIELDIMAAHSRSTGRDHKICSLVVTVDQLRALLRQIDSED